MFELTKTVNTIMETIITKACADYDIKEKKIIQKLKQNEKVNISKHYLKAVILSRAVYYYPVQMEVFKILESIMNHKLHNSLITHNLIYYESDIILRIYHSNLLQNKIEYNEKNILKNVIKMVKSVLIKHKKFSIIETKLVELIEKNDFKSIENFQFPSDTIIINEIITILKKNINPKNVGFRCLKKLCDFSTFYMKLEPVLSLCNIYIKCINDSIDKICEFKINDIKNHFIKTKNNKIYDYLSAYAYTKK